MIIRPSLGSVHGLPLRRVSGVQSQPAPSGVRRNRDADRAAACTRRGTMSNLESTAPGFGFPLLLPAWLPGETFFSLVCRYHVLSGGRVPASTNAALFGHRHQGSQHDFPNRLGEFTTRTNQVLGDAATIALTRTILPFYLPLQTQQQTEAALAALVNQGVGMLKFKLGILTSRFRANHPLKACHTCMAEDAASIGCAYWHLEHQYPGVWVCIRHRAVLRGSIVKSSGVERFGWKLPRSDQLEDVVRDTMLPEGMDALHRFAEMTLGWATLPLGTHLSMDVLSRTYRSARPGVDVRDRGGLSRLADEYCAAVRPLRVVPEMACLPSTPREASLQIRQWMYAPRGGTHPLRHLALIYWLFPDWRSFWDRYGGVATEEPNVQVAQGVVPPRAIDPRRTILISHLDAGRSVSFGAKAIGVDVATAMAWAAGSGREVARRPKVLKDGALQSLIVSLRSGTDKVDAARSHSISVGSVTRVLRTEVGLRDAWNQARIDAARREARTAWMSVMSDVPFLGTNALRAEQPAAYAWLYRNDRDWLVAQTELSRRARRVDRAPRIDWDARDIALSADVRRVAAELVTETGQPCVALWQIYQRLPELKAKLGALHRLPMTHRAVEEATRRRKRRTEPPGLF